MKHLLILLILVTSVFSMIEVDYVQPSGLRIQRLRIEHFIFDRPTATYGIRLFEYALKADGELQDTSAGSQWYTLTEDEVNAAQPTTTDESATLIFLSRLYVALEAKYFASEE